MYEFGRVGNAITIWNLEYGITAQGVFKTLDLNEAGKDLEKMTWGAGSVKNPGSWEESSMKNFSDQRTKKIEMR